MEKASVVKLQKAGYIFLRKQDYEGKFKKKKYAIKQSVEYGFWTNLFVYETKAARDRHLKQLTGLEQYLY